MNKQNLYDALHAASILALGLVPSAVGAFLGVVFQGTLTWTQRLLQFAVGVLMSHYLGGAVLSVIDAAPLVADAIKLGIAMTAYEAARRFRSSVIELAGDVPRDLWETVKSRFGGPKA